MSGKEKRSNRKKKDVSIVINKEELEINQNDDYGKDFKGTKRTYRKSVCLLLYL
jgi:hypothetical protein